MKPKVVLRPVVHVRHVRVSHARASMIVADVCFVGGDSRFVFVAGEGPRPSDRKRRR